MKNWKPASILATPQLKVASVFQALASQQQRPMNTWAVYETWDCWNKFLPVKHQIYVEIRQPPNFKVARDWLKGSSLLLSGAKSYRRPALHLWKEPVASCSILKGASGVLQSCSSGMKSIHSIQPAWWWDLNHSVLLMSYALDCCVFCAVKTQIHMLAQSILHKIL